MVGLFHRALVTAQAGGGGAGSEPIEFLGHVSGYNATLTFPAITGGYLDGDVAVVLTILIATVGTVDAAAPLESYTSDAADTAHVDVFELSSASTSFVPGGIGYHQALLFRGVSLANPIAVAAGNGLAADANGIDITALANNSMNVQWLHIAGGGAVLVPHVDSEARGWAPAGGIQYKESSGADGIITGSYLPVNEGDTFGVDLTHSFNLHHTAVILNPA